MMFLAVNTLSQRARRWLADPRLHEALWYCVPGVLVGLFLRTWLMVALPYGYYHPDTHDFVTTIYSLRAHHHFVVHGKTTFLTPVLYSLAFFPKLPALVVIPLAQHARGLLLIVMCGGLCRLWFRRWRWWIVPVTVLLAMQPAMLFWEHTLMSESGFVFCAVLLALAGTCFVRWPEPLTYGCLLGAMACVAAARPEGNLWQGAGILLVLLVYGRGWRQEGLKIAGAVVLALGMLSITKTSHSGLLLYGSLVHLTPDNPRTIPGFGPYIDPLRDEMVVRRRDWVSDDVVKASKKVYEALVAYVRDHPQAQRAFAFRSLRSRRAQLTGQTPPDALAELRYGNNVSDLCRRLAVESALAHPLTLPGYAWDKFRAAIRMDSGGVFEDYAFHEKQAFTLAGNPEIARELGRGLVGSPLDDKEQARAFVYGHYPLEKVAWFNTLEAGWQDAINWLHLPDARYSAYYRLPGLPLYHVCALLGAGLALFRPGRTRRFHQAFVPVMAGAGFAVMLTAAVIPRHRFVWEPFWMLYAFLFFDGIAALFAGRWRRGETERASVPALAVPPTLAAPPTP